MKCALILMAAIPLAGQPLRVYSELARIDASGEAVAPAQPREILSPAIARNAFTSFQIVVQVPKGTHYWLHIGQNPDDAVRITLYRESGERLELVETPYEGDSTQIFWMDVWADRDAPVRRIKVEPQLNIADDWVVYPMEVRVVEAMVPEGKPAGGMKSYLCSQSDESLPSDSVSMAGLRFRNARQDAALAAMAPKEELQRRFGPCDAPPPADPESYLPIRDYLFRLR